MTFKITFLAIMICCLFPTVGNAQLTPVNKVVPCGNSAFVLNAIKKFGENPVMMFSNAQTGLQTIVFLNKETGSATVTESSSDGSFMCIISSGTKEWAQKTSLGG